GGREAGEQAQAPSEREPLVADLGGGGEGDLVDALGRDLLMTAQQLSQQRHGQVICAGVGVQAIGFGAAKGGAQRVDEHYVAAMQRHQDLPVTSVGLSVLGTCSLTLTGCVRTCRAEGVPAGRVARAHTWPPIRPLARRLDIREHEPARQGSYESIHAEGVAAEGVSAEEASEELGPQRSGRLSGSATISICHSRAPNPRSVAATSSGVAEPDPFQASWRW